MKSKIVLASTLVAVLILHVPAFAKGDTVKIALTNLRSGVQTEVTDYAAVRRFGVWQGVGVTIGRNPQHEGFIIKWSKGAVAAPRAAYPRYEVRFYEGCKFNDGPACHSEEPSLAYVVRYAYDPA